MLSGESIVAIVNPRERRTMARRTPPRNAKGRFMKRGHSSRKARRNPRAKHHTRRASSRSHHTRRRRAHRNPRFSIPSTRMISGTLGGALVGAGGALALDLALQFGAPYLPAMVATPGIPRNLLRLGGAFLIGALSGLVVKPETRRAITAGAVTVVTYSIVKDLANQYVLPPTMQLGADDGATTYPWGWNPYLARLGHGGSTSSSDGTMMNGLRAYIGTGARSYNMPRVRAGAGATAGRARLSAYIEDGSTSPSGSGLGADIEL